MTSLPLLVTVPAGLRHTADAVGILVLLVLGALYCLFTFRRPGWILLGYAATRPLIAEFVNAGFNGAARVGRIWSVGLIILIVAYLGKAFWDNREALRGRWREGGLRGALLSRDVLWSYGPPLLLICAYFIFTLPRPDAHSAIQFGGRMTIWLLLALAVGYIARTASGQLTVLIAGYACAIVTVISIGHAMLINRYGSAYYYAPYGTPFTGQHPDGLAALAVLSMPFVLVAIMWGRSLVLSWTLLGLLTACVILSYVRISYAAAGVIVGTFLLVGLLRRKAVAAISLVVVGIVAVVGASLLSSKISNRFTAGSGRLKYWSPVWHGTISSWKASLIGRGAGESRVLTFRAIHDAVWSHNDFLEMISVGGFVLLASYLLTVGWMAWSFVSVIRDKLQNPLVRDFGAVGLATLAGFCVISFGSGLVFSLSALPLALLLGLVRGLRTTPAATFADVPDPLLRAEPGLPSPTAP